MHQISRHSSVAIAVASMELNNLLSPADVLLNVRATDKPQALEALAQQLAGRTEIGANEIVQAILGREELGSTGMGDGVAVPHARMQAVRRPIGAFARFAKPVEFGSVDEQPVDLAFMLLLPATSQGHQLNALAYVARRLRDPEIREGLRRAKGADTAYQLLASPIATKALDT
jgi:PTS system nitrogen regulatory IIA component